MKKIALICPSNVSYMPYLENYIKLLESYKVEYDVINWDRLKKEDKSSLTFRDSKKGLQRNIYDYYKYTKFIKRILKFNYYDKVIIFGIQLSFFLKSTLIKSYSGNYIVDIRDYHKLINLFDFKQLVEQSAFTVISSQGFKEWLPRSEKYVVNHNSDLSEINELRKMEQSPFKRDKINISYIGTLRDYDINIDFINSLKNKESFHLHYHGNGLINSEIMNYARYNDINNIKVSGEYSKKEEKEMYKKCDMVNVLIPATDINSRTLMPNRLYNAAKYGKPVITFDGTYVSEIVKKYNLGIILTSIYEINKDLESYIKNFNSEEFEASRNMFMGKVVEDNENFRNELSVFLKAEI